MSTAVPQPKTKAKFVPPMLLLRAERLPEGPNWLSTDYGAALAPGYAGLYQVAILALDLSAGLLLLAGAPS